MSQRKKVLLASLLIFLSAFLFRLWGISETGGTWDEDIYYNSAYHYYFNLKNLDFSRESWGWNFEHPPVAKYIYLPGAWLSQKLPPDPAFRPGVNYLPLRVESAIMGALTCVLVFLIGLYVFESFWAGIFGGVILAFLPQFVAFGKLVSLESPQTLFLTATMLLFLKALTAPGVKRGKGVKGGKIGWMGLALASALAFGTRYSSGLVFLWMGLVLLLKAFSTKKRLDFVKAAILPFSFLLFSLCFLLFSWPWLWQNPVSDFVKSFSFSGQHFSTSVSEAGYYFKYLFYTTPLVVLIMAGFAAIGVKGGKRVKGVEIISLLLWVAVFGGQGLTGLKGGGVRYALMVLPALAVLAGLGASQLRLPAGKAGITNYPLRIGLSGALVLYLVANSATVYPYLMDYYGEGVGLAWGAKKLDLPFGLRGEGIKRTVDWLNANAQEGKAVAFLATPDEAPPLRADLLRQADPTGETCYIVALPPYHFKGGNEWQLIYEEKVAGVAALGVIYEDINCGQ